MFHSLVDSRKHKTVSSLNQVAHRIRYLHSTSKPRLSNSNTNYTYLSSGSSAYFIKGLHGCNIIAPIIKANNIVFIKKSQWLHLIYFSSESTVTNAYFFKPRFIKSLFYYRIY